MDHIEHKFSVSALKGTKKKDHKYIERRGTPGNYTYIYKKALDKAGSIFNTSSKNKLLDSIIPNGIATIKNGLKKLTSNAKINNFLQKNFANKSIKTLLSPGIISSGQSFVSNTVGEKGKKSGWLKKGEVKEGHKWIKRFGTPGNYTYIYPKVINSFKKLVNTNTNELDSMMGAYPDWFFDKHEEKKSNDVTLAMIQDDIRNINDQQYYSVVHPGEVYTRDRNCGYCSIAYDMRRRGYDVQATPGNGINGVDLARIYGTYSKDDETEKRLFGKNTASSQYQNPYENVNEYFYDNYVIQYTGKTSKNLKSYELLYKEVLMGDNYKIAYIHGLSDEEISSTGGVGKPYPTSFKSSSSSGTYLTESEYNNIEKNALAFGTGARGIINMYYDSDFDGKVDGAHAQAWENINGKFTIIDGQTGRTFQGFNDIKSYNQTLMYSCYASILRTDDLIPNINVVSDYVEDAKRGKYYKEPRLSNETHFNNSNYQYTTQDVPVGNVNKEKKYVTSKKPEYDNRHYTYKTQDIQPAKRYTGEKTSTASTTKSNDKPKASNTSTTKSNDKPKASNTSNVYDSFNVNEFILDAGILGVPYATAKQIWDKSNGDSYHAGEWLMNYVTGGKIG